ncbi:MAG TPA: Na+/H+ antiporter NhaA [Steroidobacteraceae bacterium]|jgi:NhaA family Na+:H+ antiporter|nr:Na+/H+ antiporter NhaA [Steroidobacteraceae bacterium]
MSAAHAPHPLLWPLRFISIEAASGVVLLVSAAVALGWANSRFAPVYAALWHVKLGLGLAPFLPAHDLHFWVNDGLMTVFFLVVGLEIRREIHDGALADYRVATLPVIAAVGGVVVPAAVYLLINGEPALRRGWAIPTATDIAFAVGVLSLVGKGLPPALRMLLLTLAIIDDIAAILVIACFYSNGIALAGLALVAAGVLLILLMHRFSVQRALAYLLPAALVWFGMLRAGLHPTLAGVLLGLLTPATARFGRRRRAFTGGPRAESPLVRVEDALHPYVAFGIMPLFALANAGVSLQGLDLSTGAPLAVGSGVVLGLVLGKPIGIVLAALLAVKLKLGTLPEDVRWSHILLLGSLGGIGFTMSIFISNLAFEDSGPLAAAKFAVLVGSLLAAAASLILARLQPAPVPVRAQT